MIPELPLALLLAAASPPDPASGTCALDVRATPPRLEAREDRRVRVSIASRGEPRLATSAGRIEELRPAEGGGWSAVLVAPPVSIPRVAIVTAQDGDSCGFAAVPLHGAGDALVRTRPGAVVEVRIAGRAFGPARAGRDGVALIPVEVPPGVYAARHGSQEIPLGLPAVRHVAVQLDRDAAAADRDAEVGVLLVAVDDEGGPRPAPAPAVRVSDGSLSPPREAGPGAWRASWRLSAGPAEAALLSAGLPGEQEAVVSLARPPGSPATLAAALDRTRAVAGDDDPARLTLRLHDSAGNPSDGEVSVEARGASVGAPERKETGLFEARVEIPRRIPEGGRVEVSARAGTLEAAATLGLDPGPPARLDLSPDEAKVTADGRTPATLRIRVADAHGNPVELLADRLRASTGETASAMPEVPGTYRVAHVPARSSVPGAVEIEVRLDGSGLSARTTLGLRPRLPSLAVSAGAGLALRPGGGGAGLAATAEATTWRWLRGREMGLALSASLFRFRDEGETPAGAGPSPFRGEVREVVLLLSPAWRARLGRSSLAVSAGAGLARVASLVSLGGSPSVPESAWTPAAGASLAAGRRAGRGVVFLEVRAAWVSDPGLASLSRPVSPLSLLAGYRLDAL